MIEPILLNLPDAIQTARLLMRPPRIGDGAFLYEAITESLTELRRFLASLPWVAAEQTVESSEVFCCSAQANFLARKDFAFLLFEKSTNELVGVAGLHRTDWAIPKTEVGYWVRTSRSGNGFVGEAVRALVDYAFASLGAMRVELVTDEENTASRRVAERCGFQLEGTLRNERRSPAGDLRNTCIYARCAAELKDPPSDFAYSQFAGSQSIVR